MKLVVTVAEGDAELQGDLSPHAADVVAADGSIPAIGEKDALMPESEPADLLGALGEDHVGEWDGPWPVLLVPYRPEKGLLVADFD